MSENVWENPALNPTKTWEDTVEVRNELSLIVNGSTPQDRVDFLRELSNSSELELSDSRHQELATFFNKVSAAFGFVPMIEFDGNYCRLNPGIVAPLSAVFSPSYSPGD